MDQTESQMKRDTIHKEGCSGDCGKSGVCIECQLPTFRYDFGWEHTHLPLVHHEVNNSHTFNACWY